MGHLRLLKLRAHPLLARWITTRSLHLLDTDLLLAPLTDTIVDHSTVRFVLSLFSSHSQSSCLIATSRFLIFSSLLIYDFDLRESHARTLLPTALAFVSFGFVLVRVRV